MNNTQYCSYRLHGRKLERGMKVLTALRAPDSNRRRENSSFVLGPSPSIPPIETGGRLRKVQADLTLKQREPAGNFSAAELNSTSVIFFAFSVTSP